MRGTSEEPLGTAAPAWSMKPHAAQHNQAGHDDENLLSFAASKQQYQHPGGQAAGLGGTWSPASPLWAGQRTPLSQLNISRHSDPGSPSWWEGLHEEGSSVKRPQRPCTEHSFLTPPLIASRTPQPGHTEPSSTPYSSYLSLQGSTVKAEHSTPGPSVLPYPTAVRSQVSTSSTACV